jgi:ABC-type transporter Mla subunit MlaD
MVKKVTLMVLATLACAGLACGGEPDYCSDVSELEQSVRDLGDVDVVAGGTNALRDALRGVEDQAEATIEAARDDFPEETRAMRDALDSLRQSARELSDSPTPDEIAPAAADVRAMVTSVEEFAGAAQSECG